MATNFPTNLDSFLNPITTDLLANSTPGLKHATQHTNINDAVLALETKVGKDSSGITGSLDYLLKNPSSLNPGHTHNASSLSGVLPLTGGAITGDVTVSGYLVNGSTTKRGRVTLGANTTTIPHLSFIVSAAVDVSSPTQGDVWYNGTNLIVYDGATNKDLLHTVTSATGVGTNYALTNTMAAITFGTTNPAITLPGAGTFLVEMELTVDGNAGGIITAQLRNTTDSAYVGNLRAQSIVSAGGRSHLTFSGMVTVTGAKALTIYAREPTGAANDVISTETFIRATKLY